MRAALRSTHWCSAPKSSALRPCTTLHAHITGRTPCPLWHCTLPRPDSTAAAPRCQSVGEGPAAYSTLQCTIPVVYWWFLTCVPWGNRRALRALRAHWASLGGGGTPSAARSCVRVCGTPIIFFFVALRCAACGPLCCAVALGSRLYAQLRQSRCRGTPQGQVARGTAWRTAWGAPGRGPDACGPGRGLCGIAVEGQCKLRRAPLLQA